MRVTFLAAFAACIALFGCTKAFYQPRPLLFQTWVKVGASDEDVKTALLDCGYDNPYNGYDVQKIRMLGKTTRDDGMKADICMEKSGFKSIDVDEGKSLCQVSPWSKLKECK